MIRWTGSVFCRSKNPVVFETDVSFHGFVQEFPFFIHPQDYGKRAISKISFLKGIFKNLRIR